MAAEPGEITLLLRRWQDGDKIAEEQLFQLLLPELRKIAGYCFRRERPDHTLQPTAILNEAFLRLAAIKGVEWESRAHFLRLSALLMRHLLIDYARARPKGHVTGLDNHSELMQREDMPVELKIAISSLLEELKAESPQMRDIYDLKQFMGFTDEEVAETLGLSVRDAQRKWQETRKWLYKRMIAGGWKQASTTA